MSRTSETPDSATDEIRCGNCDKCLAKDGTIKCARCSRLTSLPVLPTFRQQMAYQLTAKVLSAQLLDSKERPIKVTVVPGTGYAGYVQFSPSEGLPLLSIEDMKRKLVILMAGVAAERMVSARSPRDAEMAFRQAHDLAMRITDLECADADRAKRAFILVSEALSEAYAILYQHAAEHSRLTAALLEKGELTADDIAGLAPQKTNP